MDYVSFLKYVEMQGTLSFEGFKTMFRTLFRSIRPRYVEPLLDIGHG